jgi:hypothetical protein
LSLDAIPLEPSSYREATTGPNAAKWKEAMQEEVTSLLKNNVWELVPLPRGRTPISCKWVYKIKTNPDQLDRTLQGKIGCQGFLTEARNRLHGNVRPCGEVQEYLTLRLLFAKAAQENLDFLQLDIKTSIPVWGSQGGDVYGSAGRILTRRESFVSTQEDTVRFETSPQGVE